MAPDAAPGGAAEEGDDLGDLLGGDDGVRLAVRLSNAAQPPGGWLGPVPGGVGGDHPGSTLLTAMSSGAELDGEVAHELFQRRFGRPQEAVVGHHADGVEAGDGDDGAGPSGHEGDRSLGEEQERLHDGPHREVEVLGADVEQRLEGVEAALATSTSSRPKRSAASARIRPGTSPSERSPWTTRPRRRRPGPPWRLLRPPRPPGGSG